MSTPDYPLNHLFGLSEVYELALHQALIRDGITSEPVEYLKANAVEWKPTLNVKLGVVSIVIMRIAPRALEGKTS